MQLSDFETVTNVNNGIKLIQNKNGLTYGTDALLLAAFVRAMKGGIGAELGSGSGIISLLLAERNKLKEIHCIEIQEYYASLTKRNAHLNSMSDVIKAHCADVRDFSAELDVVFTNPPYMKADSGKRNCDDGKHIARHEACGDICDFCRSAARILKFGGIFYCVYRPDRLTDLICAMRDSKIEPKRICFVHADARHKPCLVLVEGKRGGKPSCEVIRPLILSETDGAPTADCNHIYSTLTWYEG